MARWIESQRNIRYIYSLSPHPRENLLFKGELWVVNFKFNKPHVDRGSKNAENYLVIGYGWPYHFVEPINQKIFLCEPEDAPGGTSRYNWNNALQRKISRMNVLFAVNLIQNCDLRVVSGNVQIQT